MIVYTSKDSFLEIPKGLGNFSTGGSADVEPLSGSVIELSATTVTLSGAVETLNESVDSQGDAIADLLLDVTALEDKTIGNTADISALSAQTTANTAHIETLSASTVAMNNSVTANTANIATLSGITSGLAVSVETLGEVKEDIYVYLEDLTAITAEEKTAAWEALEEKYLAGHSIYLAAKSTNPTTNIIFPLTKYQPHKEGEIYTGYFGFSVIEGGGNAFYDVTFWQRGVILGNTGPIATRNVMYTLPKASSSKLGGIKVGSGVTMSGDFLNLEIGEGLGFSGNTLVVSGGSGNGPRVIILNLLSQQERADLYAELAPYRWQEKYAAVSSGFPVQDYAFYYFAGEEASDGWNDGDRGFVPMQLAMIHPDDYGGALFFTGIVKSRQGNNEILWVRYNITSTGEVDKSTGINNWYEPPAVANIYINSDGSIKSEESWTLNNISDPSIAFRTWLVISDGTGNGRGQVLNWNSINEEVDTDVWTDVYYFSALIPVGTTIYKGQWRVYKINDEWDSNHFAPTSWVAQ